jgi:PPK2 family polyphosphate:nucleotide phosphotransferase
LPIIPTPSPHLVPFDGAFSLKLVSTTPPEHAPRKKESEELLQERIKELQKLQAKLYAQDRWSLLLIFQAMDAAGKDGTVRAVMTGINPAGCQVYSFKQPSHEELDHDFLWRTARRLPERGRIGIFNRSYYEEVLVVRVHPEILEKQRLPGPIDPDLIWEERYESIREHERHLSRNGTIILKFFLHVSKEEQRRRFLARIDESKSNWKFSPADAREREHWDGYMHAYEAALRATSRPWAPWYAIPADSKPYMRYTVCEIITQKLASLGIDYPHLDKAQLQALADVKKKLESEG